MSISRGRGRGRSRLHTDQEAWRGAQSGTLGAWAEGRHLTNSATQAPLEVSVHHLNVHQWSPFVPTSLQGRVDMQWPQLDFVSRSRYLSKQHHNQEVAPWEWEGVWTGGDRSFISGTIALLHCTCGRTPGHLFLSTTHPSNGFSLQVQWHRTKHHCGFLPRVYIQHRSTTGNASVIL